MSSVPTISSVLVVPGLNEGKQQQVSLGLVLDGKTVVWGEIAAALPSSSSSPPDPDNLESILHENIIPALQGQKLDQFRRLSALVAQLRLSVIQSRTLPAAIDIPQFSRRDLLTANLEKPSGSRTEQIVVEAPLPLAVRYGVSKALLAAASQTYHLTPSQLLAHEYHLPQPDNPVPLHAELVGEQSAQLSLRQGVASLGLRVTSEGAAALLGTQGEKLQRFVRQLKQLMQNTLEVEHYPGIYLDLQGGLGQLHDNNVGKILGALYGLEQAAKPVRLRVADPVLLPDPVAHHTKMAEIKALLKLRGMSLQLIARVGVADAAAGQTVLAEGAADGVCVEVEQVGSLHQVVEAVLVAKERGAGVLLCGREPHLIAHLALATRPDLTFLYPGRDGIAPLYNEITRTLTWLRQRPSAILNLANG